ncbi:MAG: non-canonical purine NTP pyrophosphatase, partial [Pseudomonadota bacterium]|nr:non-canonical purine NTP pyrophosphatase [Pseudomonadota bacterium]
MPRRFTDDELVLASHNDGKLREIAALFADHPFRVTSAKTYNLPEPEETENSFLGNAALKARATAAATGRPALADDSGLVVPALNGAPGIYSARWAGSDRDFIMAMQKVESSL